MGIFFYVEHLSFKELSKTLQPEYKKEIDQKIAETIKKNLEDKKENEKIPWKELAAAVRRLISRYLTGEMQTTDINENLELVSQLYRTDLWEEKLGKLDDLEELITEKIKQFKLTVGQAFNFYENMRNEQGANIRISAMLDSIMRQVVATNPLSSSSNWFYLFLHLFTVCLREVFCLFVLSV